MKKFIMDYLNIIIYCILGLILMIASFYLFINYYHFQEVKTTIYVADTDTKYLNYKQTLEKLDDNLNRYQISTNKDKTKDTLYSKLYTCSHILKDTGTFYQIIPNQFYSNNDVYQLGTKFQTDVLNICYASHLSYLTTDEVDENLQIVGSFLKNDVDILSSQIKFAMDEIQNNSSYYFSTNVSSSTIRNSLNSDYTIIANTYTEFANILVNISNTLTEGGNNNDQNIE